MLSRFDDYPIHQTPEPIAHPASSDRNAYDRYWLNGFERDGEFYFGVALGLYPHRGIMDCGFSLVRDGVQTAFHASRRAPLEPSETEVGPFRIEVVEPLRVLRLTIAPNETGIECDLTFRARTACLEEGRQTLTVGARRVMDATRFAQMGAWQGEIRYDGKTLVVDAARVAGTKDRSWGVRPVGEPDRGGAPATSLPQIFFLWAPIQWPNRATHAGLFEHADGRRWYEHGIVAPVYADAAELPAAEDPRAEPMASVDYDIAYVSGTRRMKSARLGLVEAGGRRHDIEIEPLLCFRMKGIGYFHPSWGHGVWKGELALAGESWNTAELDELAPENLHIQQVVRAREGEQTGVGVLEQLAIGPHEPSGFESLLDGAP